MEILRGLNEWAHYSSRYGTKLDVLSTHQEPSIDPGIEKYKYVYKIFMDINLLIQNIIYILKYNGK